MSCLLFAHDVKFHKTVLHQLAFLIVFLFSPTKCIENEMEWNKFVLRKLQCTLIVTRNWLICTALPYLKTVRMCPPLFKVLRTVFYKTRVIVTDAVLWLSRLSLFSLLPTEREAREGICATLDTMSFIQYISRQ